MARVGLCLKGVLEWGGDGRGEGLTLALSCHLPTQ